MIGRTSEVLFVILVFCKRSGIFYLAYKVSQLIAELLAKWELFNVVFQNVMCDVIYALDVSFNKKK